MCFAFTVCAAMNLVIAVVAYSGGVVRFTDYDGAVFA
jgi:hypothetical protein